MAADLKAKLAAAAQELTGKQAKLATLKTRLAAEGATLHVSATHCAAQAWTWTTCMLTDATRSTACWAAEPSLSPSQQWMCGKGHLRAGHCAGLVGSVSCTSVAAQSSEGLWAAIIKHA